MRKFIQSCLLILFIWQIVGFVGYFEISHYHLKKEIKLLLKQGVPEDQLVKFNFTQDQIAELVWLKKNEFDLNGNLFDVVRKYHRNDGTVYMECISDKKEKELFAHLGENISLNLGDEKHPTPVTSWMKILQFPAIPVSNNELNLDFQFLELGKRDQFYYLPMISEKSVFILSPPPC